MGDFRNSSGCKPLLQVADSKMRLRGEIQSQKNGATTEYSYINRKKGKFFNKFADIYNYKCAYCGVSAHIHCVQNFQIDHFLPIAELNNPLLQDKIENLVFSCDRCNSKKRAYVIPKSHQELLFPDNETFGGVFVRNKDFSISVSQEYRDDEQVVTFFNKLEFGHYIRTLDYLLLELNSLKCEVEQQENDTLLGQLSFIESELRKERNLCIF